MRRESNAPQGLCSVFFLSPFGKGEGSWTFWIFGVPNCSHQVLTLFLIQVLKLFPQHVPNSTTCVPYALPNVVLLERMNLGQFNDLFWCMFWVNACTLEFGRSSKFRNNFFPCIIAYKTCICTQLNLTRKIQWIANKAEEQFLYSIDSCCGSAVRISAGSNWDIWHSEHGMSGRLTISVEYVSIIIYYWSEILGA